MSGLGSVWDIAVGALTAQRYGMDVTAHNIANVDTEGYSRQSPIQETKDALNSGGLIFGRGVDTASIAREADQFVESRLMEQQSNLSCYEEMENYVWVLESIFNETSDSSVSSMLSDYWNLWQDISNNPTGSAERSVLVQQGTVLAEQFNSVEADLIQLDSDLTAAVSGGISRINQISAEVAVLNRQIVAASVNGSPNDLLDRRNTLVAELSTYIDINTFEQANGTLTVACTKGCILVQDSSSYDIQLGGSDGKRVLWQGSGGNTVDMTDDISTGKIGGWLDVRDEMVAEIRLNLNALAKEFIWAVNEQHSQGVGLEALSTSTSAYPLLSAADAVGSAASGLDFYDKITDGSFTLWVYDGNGDVVNAAGSVISIDADTTAVSDSDPATDDIVSAINAVDANVTAAVSNGRLVISAANGYTFAFSDDSSHVLAALGLNTFFEGSGAGGIGVSEAIVTDLNRIASGQIDADGTFSAGDNRNALAVSDLQYADQKISRWVCDRTGGTSVGDVSTSVEEYYHSMVASIGARSESISGERAFTAQVVSNISELRDSVSGVSLDEEMANLMKFQQAYTAAAKLVTAADEMMQVLLELK